MIKNIINKKLFLYSLFLIKTDGNIFHTIKKKYLNICHSLKNWKNKKQEKLAVKAEKKTEEAIQPVADGLVEGVGKAVKNKIQPKKPKKTKK